MRSTTLLLLIVGLLCCASASPTSDLSQSCKTHTAIAGDTGWDIAQANGVTVADLERWNRNVQCSNLQIGDVLCVSGAPPCYLTYTVKSGDTCLRISQDYGTIVEVLQFWNPGLDCLDLQIGQVLCVSGSPCTNAYIVHTGDTCSSFAETHGITVERLKLLNPGLDCSEIEIGQSLCVANDNPTPPPPPPSPTAPPPPPAEYNGDVFIEYIGAIYNGVKFSDVPINSNVDFYFILAFAIDYNTTQGGAAIPSNGIFNIHWDNSVLTPEAVEAIKAQHSNVKVMVSLGGDSIQGQPVLFSPTTVASWVSNAVTSLTTLIQQFHLDGIDINYENFSSSASPETFATCIQQLITRLKQRGLISVTSIAPFDGVESHYLKLWQDHGSLIDYVNFQFYTYPFQTTVEEYVNRYEVAAAKYGGGRNLLASFNTYQGIGPPPATVLKACYLLQFDGRLPGIFVWSADHSYSTGYAYDKKAQELLEKAGAEATLYSVA